MIEEESNPSSLAFCSAISLAQHRCMDILKCMHRKINAMRMTIFIILLFLITESYITWGRQRSIGSLICT